MKKNILLSLFSIFLLAVTFFRIDVLAIVPNPTTDTGIIKITNINANDVLVAYPIVKATYDSSSNTIGYVASDILSDYLESEDINEDQFISLYNNDLAVSDINSIADNLADYISTNEINEGAINFTVSGEPAVATATVTPGSYLIIAKESIKTYSLMIANVEYKVDDQGAWALNLDNNNSVVLAAKAGDYSLSIEPVKSVDSEVVISSRDVNKDFYYHVDLVLPNYPANYSYRGYDYDLTITMPEDVAFNGLSAEDVVFSNENIKITDGKLYVGTDQVGTVTYNSDTRKIDFHITQNVGVNGFDFYIKAKLTEDNIAKDNVLSYQLVYSNPYTVIGSVTTDVTDVHMYCYKLFVYNKKLNSEVDLTGAVFNLFLENGDGDYELVKNGDGDPLLPTYDSDNHVFLYTGLASGNYKVSQITAPTGFKLADPALIDLLDDDGILEYDLTVYNSTNSLLPSTGGIGTMIFTIIGIIFVIVGATLAVAYQRRKASSN